MKPIAFSCVEVLNASPDEIAEQILDVANWPDFKGFAFLPGIRAAAFEIRTADIVGSRIKVLNMDGSSHVEEIVDWQPDRSLTLHMMEFSPPLARMASYFRETWDFERVRAGTKVVRSLQLYATSILTWPLLWMISILLKKAIARHLRQMGDKASF